jgi:TetR/AcrR family fatty acid metabolism transcriptional regulator
MNAVRMKTAAQADKILAVAARLFAAHRFHEARMEDLAAAAGVGKGTLYRYFRDKEALYLALLARAQEGMRRCQQDAAELPLSARGRLEALVAAIIDYLDRNPHFFELITHAEAMHRPGTRNPALKLRYDSINRVLRIFKEGEAAREFFVADPDVAVLLLLGGVRAIYRFGEKPRPADLARRIVTGILEGAGAVVRQAERTNRSRRRAAGG